LKSSVSARALVALIGVRAFIYRRSCNNQQLDLATKLLPSKKKTFPFSILLISTLEEWGFYLNKVRKQEDSTRNRNSQYFTFKTIKTRASRYTTARSAKTKIPGGSSRAEARFRKALLGLFWYQTPDNTLRLTLSVVQASCRNMRYGFMQRAKVVR